MVPWEERKGLFSLNSASHVVKIEIGSGHGLFKLHVHEKNNLIPKFTASVYHGQF